MPIRRRLIQRMNNQNMPTRSDDLVAELQMEDALRTMQASLTSSDSFHVRFTPQAPLIRSSQSSVRFTTVNRGETIEPQPAPLPRQEPTPPPLPFEVQEGSSWSLEQVRLARDSWHSHFETMERELNALERRTPTDLSTIAETRNAVHRAWDLSEAWRRLDHRITMVFQLRGRLEGMLPDDLRRTNTHRVLQLKLEAMRAAVVDVEAVYGRLGLVPPTYYINRTDPTSGAPVYANEFTTYPSALDAPPLLDHILQTYTRPTTMSVPNPSGTLFIINGNKVKVRIKVAAHSHLNIVVSTERGSYSKVVMSLVEKRVGLCFYRSENNFREIDHGFKLMDSDRGLIIAERKE